MKGVRQEIIDIALLGPFPPESVVDAGRVLQYENLYRSITRPISDEEARILIKIFGEDSFFGLAPSIMHLIETAPGWPLKDCLLNTQNMWVELLHDRATGAGFVI